MRLKTTRGGIAGLLCLLLFAIAACVGAQVASAASPAPTGQSATACAYADALKAVGESQKAHTEYLKVLAADPASTCAANGAKATAATTSVWDWLSGAAKHAGVAVAFVVLVSLLVVVLVLLVLQPFARWKRTRDRWPAKIVRRPSLTVNDFNDAALDSKIGPGVAGLVRGRVSWQRDRFGLHVVSGQAGVASALAGLGDVSGDAKAAVAVIQLLTALLPRRRFELKGQLQNPGTRGTGISLELSQGDAANALVTFWADDFRPQVASADAQDAYDQLAIASAAWTDHWVSTLVGGDALLSHDPLSWAYFRAGVECQRTGHLEAATTLYQRARDADGENVGALANLGIISVRTARYEDAEWYLERALAVLKARPDGQLSNEHDPDWYRIKYTLAALHTNWAASSSDPQRRKTHTQRSAELARDLAAQTLTTLDAIPQPKAHKAAKTFQEKTLKPFLEGTIEPSALVLAASTAIDEGGLDPDGHQPPASPDNGAGPVSLGAPSSPLPDLTLEAKKQAARGALAQHPVDPFPLIAYVEGAPCRPPAGLFNLACFYTRVRDLHTAAERLVLAVRGLSPLERSAMIEAARTDPTLAPLRDRRSGLMAKLGELRGPLDEADAALVSRFDLQTQLYERFDSEEWKIVWLDPKWRFDWFASRNGESKVVEIAPSGQVTAGDIDQSIGALIKYRNEAGLAPAEARAVLVIPADAQLAPGALDGAANAGVDVEDPTGKPFQATPVAA